MKAAVVNAAGEAPIYTDFPEPHVEDGRVMVELVAAGIHPAVRAMAGGRHYASPDAWPLVPGLDAVARTADGILIYTGFAKIPYGTLAERISVPANMRIPLPKGADPLLVAGAINPGISSWLPLHGRIAELGDKDLGTVLILGATGAAGLLAVQNARELGARRVIAIGRDQTRLQIAVEHGASAAVRLTGNRDMDADAIRAALDGEAPTLVLDFVWGPVAEAAFAALGRRGLNADAADISYVEIGSTAGEHAALPAMLLRSRRIRVLGSGAGSIDVRDVIKAVPAYIDLLASGRLSLPVRAVPLSQIAEAWAASSNSDERIVVIP